MGNTDNIKPETLVRYFSGEASTAEKRSVDVWRKSSTENEQIFREYKQIWNAEYHSLLPDQELERDWQKIRSRINFNPSESKVGMWSAITRIAAVFILMLAVSAGLYTYWNVPGFGRWSAFHTDDEVDSLRLPDNSVVFLNNHSSLKYLNNFDNQKRKVTLDGEGFFDVAGDPGNPFLVNTPEGVNVEVIGTSFHLEAGRGIENVQLNVTEGTVSLNYEDFASLVEEGSSARMEDRTFKIEPTSNINFLSWKTGELKFAQTPLDVTAETLVEHFDEIEKLELNTSSEVQVTTTFKDEPLPDILDELEMHFDKKFQLNDGVLTISD
ncbi:MAG: FecR domain-containing protein [Marinilabilia sp.]